MPAIIHQNQIIGQATNAEVLVKDTVGWTGKNLLKNTATTQTINGVTFTVNADGSVTANGTATANAQFAWYENDFPAGSYLLNGNTDASWGTPPAPCCVYVVDVEDDNRQYTQVGLADLPVTKKTTGRLYVCCIVRSGNTVNNVTFYPMLRKADITDPTYEPYHESVEEEIEQIYADNGVLGAKNLLKVTANTQTINGVTFTVNRDSNGNLINVTVNGTASATAFLPIVANNTMTIEKGSYILSAGDGIVGNYSKYGLYINNASGDIANTRTEERTHFTLSADTLFAECKIFVTSGTTVSNLIFKPMLRLASDPDDTYQPYAMTNRELTEKKADIYTKGDTVQCGRSLVGHVTTGTTKLELTLRGNFDKANISNVSVGKSRLLIRGVNGYLKTNNDVELYNILFSDYLKLDNAYIYPHCIDLIISLIDGGVFTNVTNNTLIDIQGMTLIFS